MRMGLRCGTRTTLDRHRDVNVFEDLFGRDAQDAIAGFNEVITLAAAVLATEMVSEAETGGELFGFDQESCAVGLPLL